MKDKLFKGYNGVIKEINDTDRSLVALISTSARDRVNEVLEPEGADLENFRKNPVVLFAHNYRAPSIGKAIWIKQAVDGIIAKVQFATTQLAEDVFQLYKKGFMRAFSVGFIGKEWVDSDGEKDPRRTYKKWELVEFSAVPVPANPEALTLALKEIQSDVLKNEFQVEKYGEDIAATIQKTFDNLTTKPEPEVTEKFIRIRIKNPDLFKKFRTITLSASEGIKAVIGRLKQDDGKTHVQSVLFDKDKWTVVKAQAWVKAHRDSLKYIIDQIEIKETVDDIENLVSEIQALNEQKHEIIKEKDNEIQRLQYSLYILSQRHKPDAMSEIADKDIPKIIEECIVGAIRHATGKVS